MRLHSWSFISLLVAACLLAPAVLRTDSAGAGWGEGYVPNTPVQVQDGRTVNFYDDLIKNKFVVISFIYTSCRDICPLATARLSQLQDRLADRIGRDVFLISITVDPEHDTPEAMKSYADTFKAGPGWFFVTGKPEYIHEIRYKLGERGRSLTEHRNDIWLGNGKTGEWQRDSAFGDIERLIMTIHSMDPDWRYEGPLTAKHDDNFIGHELTGPTGEPLFIKACSGCHTIGGGDRVGPDLLGVTERRDRAWVTRFMMDPGKMRREKDPIAMSLVEKFPIVRMPKLQLSETDAADLIAYIELARPQKPAAKTVALEPLLALTTQEGKPLAAAELEARPFVVVFGFTHCPDVCPTTLLDWTNVLQSLGPDADRFKLLFVTVDAERDTPEALKAFMSSFDPRITALTGTPAQIAEVGRAFDAFYEKIVGKDGDVTYDHTVKAYLVGTDRHVTEAVDFRADEAQRRKAVLALLGHQHNSAH